MRLGRWQYGLVVSFVALMSASLATAQHAEQTGTPEVDETQQPLELEGLRVVGSRSLGRSAADSPVPVDIIDGDNFKNYGVRDLNSLLAATIPSYNTVTNSGGDKNSLIRPAKLRGLPPDATLVLVNGKRRHRGSGVTDWPDSRSKGAHGVDIASIPAIALKRVEILRDGAGAQYGSDAVAGVMNFVLRDDREGGTLEARWGQHYHGDGDLVNVAGNIGLPLTEAGFANFSFEFTNSDGTDRSVQQDDARALTDNGNTFVRNPVHSWGKTAVKYDYKFFGNLGLDITDDHHVYAFGNWAQRKIGNSWWYRNPASRGAVFTQGPDLLIADLTPDGMSGNCPTIPAQRYVEDGRAVLAEMESHPNCYYLGQAFPGGFTPQMDGYLTDWSIAFGVRGNVHSSLLLLDGWRYDVSGVFGHNEITMHLRNTVNPNLVGLKEQIPTQYRANGFEERDKTFNIDVSRPFDTGLLYSPLHLALGLEYREEEFVRQVGDSNSWYRNETTARQGFAIGTNGSPGTRPEDAGSASRDIFAAYLDFEANLIKQVLLTAAGRYENHEGVGDSLDGKVAARWNLIERFLAVRASIGTSFRTPTIGQASYRKTISAIDPNTGRLADSAIVTPDSTIAQAFGAKPLKPETATSFGLGAVLTLGDLSVTADYYNIEYRNRVSLSNALSVSNLDQMTRDAFATEILGLATVQFFNNDLDMTIQGVDVVATYPLELFGGGIGRTLFTLAGNWNTLKVDSYSVDITGDWLATATRETEPEFRFVLSADHGWGPWRLLTRLKYYDDFQDFSSYSQMHAHARTLLDLEASYTFFDSGVVVAVGAENLFDTYPTRNTVDSWGAPGRYGMKYPDYSPYGFSGGFYYFRASYSF